MGVFALATGGLLVAIVIKHADNLLRQFSTALSIILTSLVSALVLQEFTPDALFALGAFLAIVATFMYNFGIPRIPRSFRSSLQPSISEKIGLLEASNSSRASKRPSEGTSRSRLSSLRPANSETAGDPLRRRRAPLT